MGASGSSKKHKVPLTLPPLVFLGPIPNSHPSHTCYQQKTHCQPVIKLFHQLPWLDNSTWCTEHAQVRYVWFHPIARLMQHTSSQQLCWCPVVDMHHHGKCLSPQRFWEVMSSSMVCAALVSTPMVRSATPFHLILCYIRPTCGAESHFFHRCPTFCLCMIHRLTLQIFGCNSLSAVALNSLNVSSASDLSCNGRITFAANMQHVTQHICQDQGSSLAGP